MVLSAWKHISRFNGVTRTVKHRNYGVISKADRLCEFTPIELRQLRALKTPAGVQHFLDSLPYHLADTAWSPRQVLRERTAHCLEGAIFGAAALRVLGFPPLLWDLEAVNDTDHVLAIFKMRRWWGTSARRQSDALNCYNVKADSSTVTIYHF